MTEKIGAAGSTTAAPKEQQKQTTTASNSRTPNVAQVSSSATGAATSGQDVLPTTSHVLAEHAAAIRQIGKRVIADLIEVGGRLNTCRDILKDDRRWRAWLKTELKLSHQSAGRFIQIYELAEERSNLDHLDLSVSAIYLLAAPSTPESARDEIIERAASGERLSHAGVQATIAEAKGRQEPAKPKQAKSPTKPKSAPATDKPAAGSRSAQWEAATADAAEALGRLQDLQQAYCEWRDNLPENLQSGILADKLDAVCEIDIDSAVSVIEEAEGLDLPLGFGRD
jgi:hypothetical protein